MVVAQSALLHFCVGNEWVQLSQQCLILLEVVKGAVVGLSVLVFHAEDVGAFARHFKDANSLCAGPAFIQVCL